MRVSIANGSVGHAANEGEVGDVVGFPLGVGALEHRLRVDVMELEPVLTEVR